MLSTLSPQTQSDSPSGLHLLAQLVLEEGPAPEIYSGPNSAFTPVKPQTTSYAPPSPTPPVFDDDSSNDTRTDIELDDGQKEELSDTEYIDESEAKSRNKNSSQSKRNGQSRGPRGSYYKNRDAGMCFADFRKLIAPQWVKEVMEAKMSDRALIAKFVQQYPEAAKWFTVHSIWAIRKGVTFVALSGVPPAPKAPPKPRTTPYKRHPNLTEQKFNEIVAYLAEHKDQKLMKVLDLFGVSKRQYTYMLQKKKQKLAAAAATAAAAESEGVSTSPTADSSSLPAQSDSVSTSTTSQPSSPALSNTSTISDTTQTTSDSTVTLDSSS